MELAGDWTSPFFFLPYNAFTLFMDELMVIFSAHTEKGHVLDFSTVKTVIG